MNRGCLSGSAASLTFGAQTGRGSDHSCVIKHTLDHEYQPLITLVRQLAQNAAGSVLPYLGFQILRLGPGQNLNQHRDYHNHADYPSHTMKFGKYTGGSLQMLRDGKWHSYDTECQWMSFDALKSCRESYQRKLPTNFGQTKIFEGFLFGVSCMFTPKENPSMTPRMFFCSCPCHGQWRDMTMLNEFSSLCVWLKTSTDTQHFKQFLKIFRLCQWQATLLLVCEPVVKQCGDLKDASSCDADP